MGSDRGGRRLFAAAMLGVTWLALPHALAQPTVADRETARALLQEADADFARGELEAALAAYRSAYAVVQAPTILLAVARTEVALGRLLDARESALSAVRSAEAPEDPPQFARARAEAAGLAADLSRRIPSLRVVVQGPGPEHQVRLLVDGAPVAVEGSIAFRKVDPGKHRLAASAPGYRERSEEVVLGEGEERVVSLELAAAPAAREPASTAGLGTRSGAGSPAPAGDARGALDLSPLVFVGFGIAAAGVVAGSVTGGMSIAKTSDLEDICPNGRCPDSALDTPQALATASNIAFAFAGAGALLGVVGIVVSKRTSGSRNQAWIVPKVTPLSIALAGGL